MGFLLIKTDELPSACYECPCYDGDHWCDVLKDSTRDVIEEYRRLDNCPLIFVEGPLIDKQSLMNADADIHQDCIDSDGYCLDSTWGFSREMIENFPEVGN